MNFVRTLEEPASLRRIYSVLKINQVYKLENTRFDTAWRVNECTTHRQREARISQKAFSTPYMFAGHALGTRWMGVICALSAGIFVVFFTAQALSHIAYHHARPAHKKIKNFGQCVVIRWACVRIH